MNLKPLANYVQIKIRQKVTKSGIVISSDEISDIADIVAVGPDVKNVSVGDAVIYNRVAGTLLETKFDRLLEENDILAKFEE